MEKVFWIMSAINNLLDELKTTDIKPTIESEAQVKENVSSTKDAATSFVVGNLKGISYLIDLPQAINELGSMLVEKSLSPINNFIKRKMGKSEEEIDAENQLSKEIESKMFKIEPGKIIRENVLTYQPRTTAGQYAETMGEFAAPGGVLGKGVKGRAMLYGTGFGSWAVGETAEQLSGSEGLGTAVGVGTNIVADILALRRGNVAGIAKTLLPKEETISNTQKLQNYAASKGLKLTAGEASGKANLIATEGNIRVSLEGGKIMDDFYETRPEQIKNFIKNFAKEVGLITDPSKLSRTRILDAEKKAGILLQANRSKLWNKAGGDKFNKTFFNQVDVDNIVAKISKMQTEKINKPFVNILEDYKQQLLVSDANGKNLHDIFKNLQDSIISISKNPNKTSALKSEQRILTSVKDDLDSLLRSNKDFANAQKKYVQYTNAYIKPIDKTKLFKDISVAGWVDDADVVGRVYRFLGSDKVSPRDIEKLANSFGKAGNYEKWRLIMSGYFDEAFTKALADNMGEGLNMGSVFHKAMVGSPKNRTNFTEMLYQLARQRGDKITRTQMAKAVDNFAMALKASGRNAKAGSPTAGRTKQMQDLQRNFISQNVDGIPILTYIKNIFNERTLSKNSELFAKRLTSDEGIAAFVDLAQNFKDPAKLTAAIRAIALGERME